MDRRLENKILNQEQQQDIVGIVDAYSSANLYAAEFLSRGFFCVHIQSTPQILPVYKASFRANDFIQNIIHKGNVAQTVHELSKLNIKCLIAGIESGVILADSLSEALGLKTNGTELSLARRDKFLMQEALKKNRLTSIVQFKSHSLTQIKTWLQQKASFPVVVKPLHSAGTEGVRFCKSYDEVEVAFHALIGKENKMGLRNDEVLIQELLEGIEYIVDTVSCNGKHYVTDIWQYKKSTISGINAIYEDEFLLPSSGKIQESLRKYIFTVLDALNIKYGPVHSEIMMTQNGPILIEAAARINGAFMPKISKECIGLSQVDLTADAYLNPNNFEKKTFHPYQLQKNGRILFLISPETGKLKSLPYVEKIKGLESFFDMYLSVAPGEKIFKTVDLFTCPGFIQLAHKDEKIIRCDYEQIQKWEKENFYPLY